MYYLKKEAFERTIEPIKMADGTIIPERKYIEDARAIFKHNRFSRVYRGIFQGLEAKYQGMKIYMCKSLRRILELRKEMFEYCGEWFDVYDENGKVNIESEDK